MTNQTTASSPPAFEERQRFRNKWILLPVVVLLGVIGLFGWMMVQQLVMGQVVGSEGKQMSDPAMAVVATIVILVCLLILWILLSAELYVAVRDDGIEARLKPLGGGVTKWEDVESATARDYQPIREFGGWGIRMGKTGKAYTVSGNRGVELQLSDERTLLIGSQRADELAAAINEKLKAHQTAGAGN